jgi:hypothetical protein
VSSGFATCIYVATCTWPTVRHVYSDRTRGDLQVAKNKFFCSVWSLPPGTVMAAANIMVYKNESPYHCTRSCGVLHPLLSLFHQVLVVLRKQFWWGYTIIVKSFLSIGMDNACHLLHLLTVNIYPYMEKN